MPIELPQIPDENTYTLLNRARLMLSHAQEHAAHGSEIDRMVAIHGFDNTVEYLLRIVLNFLDVEATTGKSVDSVDLASLAGEVNRFLLKEHNIRLPYLSEVKLLRQVRNLVQHGVVDPNPDLKRFATITERFYEAVLLRVFGIVKEELKTSVIINHSTLREHLISCEKAIDEKRFLEAIVAARDAFENGYYQRTKDSDVTINMMPAIVEARVTKSQGLWSLVKVMEELELSRLGINTAEYRRFNDYLRYIPSDYKASDSGYSVMQRPWAVEDAQFCYAFVANTLLKWQSSDVPPIQEYSFNSETDGTNEFIGEIDLNGPYEGGCLYVYDEDHELQLWYLDKSTKDLLESLETGKEYEYLRQVKEAGSIKREVRYTIELLGLHSTLITNVPERWQVIAWYKSSKDYVSKEIEASIEGVGAV